MFSLIFKIGPPTAISMERAWKELSIDMVVGMAFANQKANRLVYVIRP